MLYDATNCHHHATVYEAENGATLAHVVSVDTSTGEVNQLMIPTCLVGDEFLVTTILYEFIHAIPERCPELFICYVRK